MNVAIKIDYDKMGLRYLVDMVTGPKSRASLLEAMGMGVREITRVHLGELAGSRHATAQRLQGEQTGFLAQAARAVEGSPVTTGADSATLTINHPGLSRAFHDVTIVPTKAKALAIPVAAIAYGRSPRQFTSLFIFKSKVTGNAFLAERQAEKSDKPLLLYLLVRSVTQKQDRSLLPSQEQWEAAAAKAANDWFTMHNIQVSGGNS